MNRSHSPLFAVLVILAACVPVQAAQDVVIYSDGFAAVYETRIVTFSPDQGSVSISLPAGLIGDSLWLEIADGVVPFSYQLVPGKDLAASLLGHVVEVVDTNGHLYRGTLLTVSDDLVLEETDGRILILQEFVRLRVSEPMALTTDPFVYIHVAATVAGDMPVTLLYLENGLTWETNYVAVLSSDETTLSLNAATTIANTSGRDLVEAGVSLIAGDVNTVDGVDSAVRAAAVALAYEMNYASAEAASEYYRYSLSEPLTLADNASVTVPYSAASGVPVVKTYAYDGLYGRTVEVVLAFDNTADDGLGIPLPAGAVRAYTLGNDGFLFLGSDTISHIPVGETVNLEIGTAFDLAGERTVLSRTEPADNVYQETIQVTLHNYKNEAATVIVTEHPSGNSWEILDSSNDYEAVASNTIEFTISVSAGETAHITYTSQYTY